MVAERGSKDEDTDGPAAASPETIEPARTSKIPGRIPMGPLFRGDAKRAIGAAVIGCSIVALVELVATIVSAGKVSFAAGVRLAFLDLTLFGLMIVPVAFVTAVVAVMSVQPTSAKRTVSHWLA